jgi:hypothetical protein
VLILRFLLAEVEPRQLLRHALDVALEASVFYPLCEMLLGCTCEMCFLIAAALEPPRHSAVYGKG